MPDNITVQESIDALPDPLLEPAFLNFTGEQPWSTRRIKVAQRLIGEKMELQGTLYGCRLGIFSCFGSGLFLYRDRCIILLDLDIHMFNVTDTRFCVCRYPRVVGISAEYLILVFVSASYYVLGSDRRCIAPMHDSAVPSGCRAILCLPCGPPTFLQCSDID